MEGPYLSPQATLGQPWILERLLGAQAQQRGLPAHEFFMPLFEEWETGSLPQCCCDTVINVHAERTRPVFVAAERPCQLVGGDEQRSPHADSCPDFWKRLSDGAEPC